MDHASILATFPRELRHEVFLTSTEEDLARLPPALLAEARAVRERARARERIRQNASNMHAAMAGSAGAGGGAPPFVPSAAFRTLAGLAPPPRSRGAAVGTGVAPTEPTRALLGDDALACLVSLLRLTVPLPGGKNQLQRLLLFLSANEETAKQIAWRLALLFRPRLVADASAEPAEQAAVAAAVIAFDAVCRASDALSERAAAAGMFGADPMGKAEAAMGASGENTPAVVSRRALECSAYVCKHSESFGELCMAGLPPPEVSSKASSKGKSKGKSKQAPAAAAGPSPLVLVLKLLGTPVYTRSSAQLESALSFLEQVLKVADIKAQRRSEERFAQVQAAAERSTLEAHRAALRAVIAHGPGPAGMSAEAVDAAARSASVDAPGAGGESAMDELKRLAEPTADALPGLCDEDLRRIPALLALPGLTELAYAKAADVLKHFTTSHTPALELFITELGAAAARMRDAVAAELASVAACAKAGAEAAGQAAVGGAGAGLLRVLQAMRMLTTRADAVEASRARLQQALAKARAATRTGKGEVDAAGGSVDGKDAAGSPPEVSAGATKRRALVLEVAVALEPALAKLSSTAATVEEAIGTASGATRTGAPAAAAEGAAAAAQAQAQAQASALPPTAGDLLPFIQSFFALCEAAGQLPPKPESNAGEAQRLAVMGGGARTEQPIALSRVVMVRTASASEAAAAVRQAIAERDGLKGSLPSTPLATPAKGAAGGAGGSKLALSFDAGSGDEGSAFVRFCERHRALLNAYVRQARLLEGPLEPLSRVPRLLDFDNKRALFRQRVRAHATGERTGTLRVNVRRAFVLEDSFHQLRMRSPVEMRGKLQVQFAGEQGVDAGGLTREWFGELCKEFFKENYALFSSTNSAGTTFQPNPLSYVNSEHLSYFKFVGRIVGKALYDGQLMDAHFTRSLYKHMLGMPVSFHDVEAVDPEFYKTLVWMLENDITGVLDLTFTAEADEFAKGLFGEDNTLAKTVELCEAGAEREVTEANKHEYVALIAEHKMAGAIRTQVREFLKGFYEIMPRSLISIFDDAELELLISGLPDIDVEDLRANTDYNGYSAGSRQIVWFWDVVRSLEREDLARLLQFITGTSKVPLEGFAALAGIQGPQKFNIHRVAGQADRLPAAHTCFNQVDLPEYESRQQLKDKLMTAITEGSTGFLFA